MEKRFIGIDIDHRTLRVAVARPDKSGPVLVKLARFPLEDAEQVPALLEEVLGTTRIYGDRMVAALPPEAAFYRWVKLPFSDPKKLAAAGRLSLASQLPVNMDDCLLSYQAPRATEQGSITAMAAVPRQRVAEFLAPFDQAETALQLLDLLPFAIAQGLSAHLRDAVVLILCEEHGAACLLRDRQLADCRLLPAATHRETDRRAAELLRICTGMRAHCTGEELPLVVMGAGATQEMLTALRRQGGPLLSLDWRCGNDAVAAEFLPAATLALRAGQPERQGRPNLRQGDFALRGEWAALKKRLVTAGSLLFLCLGLLTGSAWLHHAHKADTAAGLRQQMQDLYRQTFPEDKMTRDPHRQMLGRLGRAEEEGRMLGLLQGRSALEMLRALSEATPADMLLDTRELRYGQDGITLDGTTDTFDAVNRLARAVQRAAPFEAAQVADAKQSADGSRIDFRLQITLSQKETP